MKAPNMELAKDVLLKIIQKLHDDHNIIIGRGDTSRIISMIEAKCLYDAINRVFFLDGNLRDDMKLNEAMENVTKIPTDELFQITDEHITSAVKLIVFQMKAQEHIS